MFLNLDKDQQLYVLLEKGIQRGILYHIFFWIVFYFFLIIVDNTAIPLSTKMIHKALRVSFYVVIVYSNINYLFNKYLKSNQLVLYVIFLILLVALVTPIEVVLHYLLFSLDGTNFSDAFNLENNSKYFLGGFFIAFSSSIYKIINDWMEHQRERSELQRQNLRSELKFLKTQINPHFFFNTLNSLYALTLKKSDKAPEIVLMLSDMMRYMLYESNERTIDLSKEIKYIENYLALEKVRHGENFKIQFTKSGDSAGHQIAPLLFIPFIENCFKHGIDHELKSGYVNIHLDIKDHILDLKVKNSMPNNLSNIVTEKKAGGIGLVNVRRRLNILYPSQYTLMNRSEEKEYQVHMTLKNTKSSAK